MTRDITAPCRDCHHFDCLMDRGEPLPDWVTGYWSQADRLAERPYQPTPEGVQRAAERVARRRGVAVVPIVVAPEPVAVALAPIVIASSTEAACRPGDR